MSGSYLAGRVVEGGCWEAEEVEEMGVLEKREGVGIWAEVEVVARAGVVRAEAVETRRRPHRLTG